MKLERLILIITASCILAGLLCFLLKVLLDVAWLGFAAKILWGAGLIVWSVPLLLFIGYSILRKLQGR